MCGDVMKKDTDLLRENKCENGELESVERDDDELRYNMEREKERRLAELCAGDEVGFFFVGLSHLFSFSF